MNYPAAASISQPSLLLPARYLDVTASFHCYLFLIYSLASFSPLPSPATAPVYYFLILTSVRLVYLPSIYPVYPLLGRGIQIIFAGSEACPRPTDDKWDHRTSAPVHHECCIVYSIPTKKEVQADLVFAGDDPE